MPLSRTFQIELRAKLRSIVSLDALHSKGQLRQDIVDKGDRALLSVCTEDLQDSDASAVVDGGELVTFAGPASVDETRRMLALAIDKIAPLRESTHLVAEVRGNMAGLLEITWACE
jgi:hypothetical protein